MPQTVSATCDGPACTSTKGESNHWFVLAFNREPGHGNLGCWIEAYDGTKTYNGNCLILCGVPCVQKAIAAKIEKLFSL